MTQISKKKGKEMLGCSQQDVANSTHTDVLIYPENALPDSFLDRMDGTKLRESI